MFAANNDGIECSDFRPDIRIPEAALSTEIRYKFPGASCRLLDGTGKLRREDGADRLYLEAGDWVLLGIAGH